MIRLIWKTALASALFAAGLNGNSLFAATPTSVTKTPYSSIETPPNAEIITLKQDGVPDRKCVIVSTSKRTDGTLVHQVKALDNGEMMTILETPSKVDVPVVKTSPKPMPMLTDVDPVPSAENPPKKSTTLPNKPTTSPTSTEKKTPLVTKAPEVKVAATMPVAAKPETPPEMMPMKGTPLTPIQSQPQPLVKKTTTTVAKVAPTQTIEPLVMPMPVQPMNPMQIKLEQMKEVMKEALQPSHREMAAEQLCSMPQGKSLDVRKQLLSSVQEDPAATVRATCLRCLVKQGIQDDIMQAALVSAQKDKDVRVRNECQEAMQILGKE